jgi:nucleotide-binding universal stress UspA family protein
VPRLVLGGHEVIALSRGSRAPYHASLQWNSVTRITADREAEDAAGTFGARIAALERCDKDARVTFPSGAGRQESEPMSTDSDKGRIVVGIDGSPRSQAALTWAIEEARLRGLGLRIIYAFPALVSFFGTTAHEYYPQVEAEAHSMFEKALAAAPSTDDLDVERTLEPGNPAEILVEASRGASLLVVGSHGRGGFRGMLIGSVSMHCAQQAHCPVLVVRHEDGHVK